MRPHSDWQLRRLSKRLKAFSAYVKTLHPFAQADAPPYAIANNNVRLPLSFRAIPVTARHYDGSLQYDAHNIYGLSQAAATHRALNAIYKGEALFLFV